jgi:hypothetical protein
MRGPVFKRIPDGDYDFVIRIYNAVLRNAKHTHCDM